MGFRLRGGEVDVFTGCVGGCVRVVRSVAKRFSDWDDTGMSATDGRYCGVETYDRHYHWSATATRVYPPHHS
jgi:hypothetical protein